MAAYVVWMDSEKALIFNLGVSGIVKTQLKKSHVDHHSHNKKDHHADPGAEHFYKELAQKVKDGQEILVVGPGLAKNHFRTYLDSHVHGLAKKIVGLENSDHPTDNQILAAARKFFASYHLYHEPIKFVE